MKTNLSQAGVMLVFLCVFSGSVLCNQQPIEQSDKNLSDIIDLEQALDETPSQFACQSFKDVFEANSVERSIMNDRPIAAESKTSIFQKSFIKYVKEIYNKRNYANILSQDGSHILQFLDLSNEMNLGPETVYVCFRLFYNKIKACELIDDTVVLQILNPLPSLVGRYFVSENTQDFHTNLSIISKNIENILLTKFTDHLIDFQNEPESFVSKLATELTLYYQKEVETIQKQHMKEESVNRLREITIRFFDTALGKVIWDPSMHVNIWESFISMGQGLGQLATDNILNHMDDLDDLLWTLVHRFCFFLDLTGTRLPLSFYQEVETDLENGAVFFLEYKEQDEGITTKKETIMHALVQAKTRALAYEKKGIL